MCYGIQKPDANFFFEIGHIFLSDFLTTAAHPLNLHHCMCYSYLCSSITSLPIEKRIALVLSITPTMVCPALRAKLISAISEPMCTAVLLWAVHCNATRMSRV